MHISETNALKWDLSIDDIQLYIVRSLNNFFKERSEIMWKMEIKKCVL